MLSASFYANDKEVGYLTLTPNGGLGRPGGEHEYDVEWFGEKDEGEGDASTKITRYPRDGVFDLFAMALVEVDAILAERAVN